MPTASISSLSPVRIYILWHPGLDESVEVTDVKSGETGPESKPATQNQRGLLLARRLYHWFRLENMEGIPVYFRSAVAYGDSVPPPLYDDPGILNYIIPLIDANMVASPDWRRYVSAFVGGMLPTSPATGSAKTKAKKSPPAAAECVLLPVAMEPLAYNMPESMRRLNFIRHIAKDDQPVDDETLIARLTEVICRDLRARMFQKKASNRIKQPLSPPDKIKIFLSHAKADDTKEAIALKEYIQRETQCEAFFDETDIASGYDYARILENSITQDSAGLVVIQGDNYADRPWCRKEIRDFLQPFAYPNSSKEQRLQYFIHPVIVVQTMKGHQIARTIPELGYSPCIRWATKTPDDYFATPRFVVTTLLREILFSLFHRLLAESIAERKKDCREIFINRSPDPFLINRILANKATNLFLKGNQACSFVHPGYGLSGMDREGLKAAFPQCEFTSFLSRSSSNRWAGLKLKGKVIAISVGNPGDILAKGLWDEHIQELLVRLLRPLLHAQASILYGGTLPKNLKSSPPWEKGINFTVTMLRLLAGERQPINEHEEQPRLYIPTPCHELPISAKTIAQWTDICSFVPVTAEDTGIELKSLQEPAPPSPDPEELAALSYTERQKTQREYEDAKNEYHVRRRAIEARAYSAMRRKVCDSKSLLVCSLPDSLSDTLGTKRVKTHAHILIGGKLLGFAGIMPGLFEEFLHAVRAKKPIYLISEYGGAAALLAKWLIHPPAKQPPELTIEYYKQHSEKYAETFLELEKLPTTLPKMPTPQDAFDKLRGYIDQVSGHGDLAKIFRNGLTHYENLDLLSAGNSGTISRLIWTGIGNLKSTTKKETEHQIAP
ncbi:TIR domain-containing protein [Phragmitibacter flavus]|uniref:TIR domain-containing protein n=1 Tax=Phragmitibacter flavus TaxID=2576071 RepID=A0A5R8KHB5_9BACT|nr:TIR domain-containing protein [Phragmitibacter flavus]TLD71706.1 TIR domain-containing protein [Phragmitibacter flavus]